MQLDTVDYILWQITLQAVEKTVAISSQFKNKSHLSKEIKNGKKNLTSAAMTEAHRHGADCVCVKIGNCPSVWLKSGAVCFFIPIE